MSFPSPFLDANPSYAILLNGAVPPPGVFLDGEYIWLSLHDKRGVVTWESSLRPVKIGFGDFSEVPFSKFAVRPFRVYIHHLLIHRGKRYRSSVVVRWVYPKGVPPRVMPDDYGSAIRKVRGYSAVKVTLPPGKRTSNQRSSTLRLNPETRSRVRQNFTEGNNGGYFFSPSISSETVYTRTWSGVRTPGYGALRKQQRPVNPHTVVITDVQDAGLIEMLNIPSTGVYFNQYSAFTRRYSPPAAPTHNDLARQKAINKLLRKLEAGVEANLAQDLAQIGQAVKLITDSATRLAKSGVALKNGNIPKAIATLWGSKQPRWSHQGGIPTRWHSTADNWLAMQYGWKPLLDDIHGAVEAVAKLNLADASVKQVTSSSRVETWDVHDLYLVQNPDKVAGWTRVQTSTLCKFGIRYTVEDHLKAFLGQTGFLSPVSLVWELLPFSFVVDWFLPIGPWLDTLEGYHGLVMLDGYQTQFTRQQTESLVRFAGPIGSPAPGQDLQAAGQYSSEAVVFERIKLNTFPANRFPPLKNPVSGVHAANALALLKSVFR